MKTLTLAASRNREQIDVLAVTTLSIFFSMFGISVHFIEKIYLYLNTYYGMSTARFAANFLFLYLTGLLWLTFRRWRNAEKKRRELEGVITSIDPDTLVVLDQDRNIVMCSHAVERMFGYAKEEILHRKIDMLYRDSRSHSERWEEIRRIIGREGFHIELATGVRKDGRTILIEVVTGTLGVLNGTVSLIRDVTEKKKNEEALKQAYWELDQIFNTAADGMWVVDESRTVLKANDTLLRMLGASRQEVVGRKCHEAFPCPRHGTPECSLTAIRADGKCREGEVEMRPAGQPKEMACLLTAAPFGVSDDASLSVIEDFRDVTRLKEMEEELRALSLVDGLTGLYNRRAFLTLAEQQRKLADRTQKGMRLVFVDMDQMKWINDTLGHDEGDQALKAVAEILRNSARASDIAARMGGDEFVMLVTESERDSAEAIEARLRKNLETWNEREGKRYDLSLSIGSEYYEPRSQRSIGELIHGADTSMYVQKKRKKGGEPPSDASGLVAAE